MKLHDPLVESEIIRIARNLAGSRGFEKTDHGFWRSLPRRLATCLAILFVAAVILVPAWKPDRPEIVRQTICVLSLMFLVRVGLGQIAMTFTRSGFFSTLANLPITGRTALLHLRGLVFRSFLPLAVTGSLAAATLLHIHAPEPMTWTAILRTAALLSAVLWATLGIVQIRWIKWLRFDLLWQWSAYGLVAFLVLLHFTGEAYVIPEAIREPTEKFLDHLLWIFPPAWVFPGRIENSGLIATVPWIAWGIWSWMRWPSVLFQEYDRPIDLPGAFGDIGTGDEKPEKTESIPAAATEAIQPGPATAPGSSTWLDRLITARLRPEDRAVASAMASSSGTAFRAVNFSIVLAPVWLLAVALGKDLIPKDGVGEFLHMAVWIAPGVIFFALVLPLRNPLAGAIQPYPVGNDSVPFFATLPVSLRTLLRITFRITAVRTCLGVLIATPFYWVLAKIYGTPDIASGVLAAIPAIGAAWIASTPAMLANRLEPHARRREGVLVITIASSLAMIPIGVLWACSSFAGIAMAFAWASGAADGRYAFLLLPAALAALAFAAAMSLLLFESLHLFIRQRHYDWKSKIR